MELQVPLIVRHPSETPLTQFDAARYRACRRAAPARR
jgi:hypothetical protein